MSRDNYNSIEQFVNDASFVSWVESRKIDDKDHWEGWLLAHPDKASLVLDAELSILGVQFRPADLESNNLEAALSKLHASLDHKVINIAAPKKQITRRRIGVGIAAVLIVLILSTIGIKVFIQPIEVVYTAAYGERIDLKLADGSAVTLNANSTLSYYSNDTRNVWLEGEAFFEVEKKPSTGAKFIVHTADLDIEVLGTAFNVNSSKDKTNVVLEEGKINLKLKDGSSQIMKPGELVTYSATEKIVIKKEARIDPEIYTSWKDGVLLFKEITLKEAMMKIESTYGVEVLFENKEVAERIISFAIPTKNLQLCVEAIEKSMGVDIEKEGDRLKIFE